MPVRHIIFILIACIFFSGCNPKNIEYVFIPDQFFLLALVDNGIDSDNDGKISLQEANSSTSIILEASGISELTGLEYFSNLDTLIIRRSYLPEIDLSALFNLHYLEITACELESLNILSNTQLQYLDVSGGAIMSNQLERLDISQNTMLEVLKCNENDLLSLNLENNSQLRILICGRNKLEALDLSVNQKLEELVLNNNLVSQLDLSNNPGLVKMISCGNQLTSLDISGNIELQNIGIDNMSSLYEVCVWTLPFPPSGVSVLMGYSPNVIFTDQCK